MSSSPPAQAAESDKDLPEDTGGTAVEETKEAGDEVVQGNNVEGEAKTMETEEAMEVEGVVEDTKKVQGGEGDGAKGGEGEEDKGVEQVGEGGGDRGEKDEASKELKENPEGAKDTDKDQEVKEEKPLKPKGGSPKTRGASSPGFFRSLFSRFRSQKPPKGKEYYESLPIDQKRKLYKCRVTLDQIEPWSVTRLTVPTKLQSSPFSPAPSLDYKVSLWRGDITRLEIDAIVNAAKSSLLHSVHGVGKVNFAIHNAAGYSLYDECLTLNGCPKGHTKISSGHQLPAKYILHTVGPMNRDQATLKSCYNTCFNLVLEHNIRSVAFCCIATGGYGYPNEDAAEVALTITREWLEENSDKIDRVIFCVFLEKDYEVYRQKLCKFFPPDIRKDEDGDERGDDVMEGRHSPASGSAPTEGGDNDSENEEQFIEEAMSGEKRIKRKLAHSILVGPPGSGKSSLMDRLLCRQRKEFSPSTGVSEPVVVVDVNVTTPSTFHSITVESGVWKEVEYHESLVGQIITTRAAVNTQLVSEVLPAEVSLDTNTTAVLVTEEVETQEVSAESIRIKPVCSINFSEARKIIKSVINENYGGYKNFKKFLKNSFSIYLRDTGGQLVFQEMLPLLVFGPSIFLFVFRLDQDLKSKFSVEYRMKAGEALNRYTSSITIEEAFLQCLASVYAMDVPSKCVVKTHPSLVFVIGTHKDKLGSLADKRIADINESLSSLIMNSDCESFVQYADRSKGQVMFTVDNTSDSDKDFKLIRSRVNRLISKREMFTIEYPIRYLLFSLELQGTKRNVLSLDECKTMAAKYGIGDNQLLHLLEFLHIRVGIIRYFDKEGVRHIVIKETQVLFNILTSFIIQSFSGDILLAQEEKKFKQMGIFSASLFKEIIGNVDDMLTPDELLQLLVHLRLAVSFTEDGEKKYFLPSILSHIPESSEEELTDIPSLTVQFKCGHCPKGLFGVLVTHLMTTDLSQLQGTTSSITSITLIQHKIFKYQVSFEVCSPDLRDEISLKVHAAHLEIKFFPELSEDRQSLSVCNDIRLILEDCIDRSLKDLHYCKSRVSFQLCLKCVNDQCSMLHEVDRKSLKLHCQKTRVAQCLSPEGRWWFSKESTASAEGELNKRSDQDPAKSQNTKSTRLTEQDLAWICEKLGSYSYEWRRIAQGLRFIDPELSTIEAKPHLLNSAPYSYLCAMLSSWLHWAPGDGRGSMGYATLESLRRAVDRAGLGDIAQELRNIRPCIARFK